MTSFFKALRDAKETDVNGQKVLKVSIEKVELLDKLQLTRPHGTGTQELNFLLRKEYDTLVEDMQVCKKRGAIVVGTSGIGKSAFRFYMMRRWLKNDEKLPQKRFPKVLFNLGVAFYEMDASGTVSLLANPVSFPHLPQDRLALLDPCHQIAGLDKSLHFNFMLVTTSASPLSGQETKTGNYKELVKALEEHQLGTVLVMHVWSYEEIKAVAPDASDELIRNFGCVPRWCLRDDLTDEEEMRRALEKSAELKDFKALYEFLKSKPLFPLAKDRCLPYKVMKIESQKGLWGTKSFISKFVASFFVEKAQEASQHECNQLAQMMKNPFSMQAFGHMFEEWAYKKLVEGMTCTFDAKQMKGRFSQAGTFERNHVSSQKSMKPKIERGALLRAPINYGSIDMFGLIENEDAKDKKWQLLMFQETVGQQHREARWNDIQNIVGACRQIATEKDKELECLLIYLLPKGESYENFKCPTCTELSGKVVSVVKGSLAIDMPDALTGLKTWEEALETK